MSAMKKDTTTKAKDKTSKAKKNEVATKKSAEKKKEKETLKVCKRKQEAMLKCLVSSEGVIKEAARKAGIERRSHYNWMENDPEYAEKVREIQEGLIDEAECYLRQAMKEGNVTAIIFYLKTKGKNRGYTETQEVSGTIEITADFDR